MTVRLEENLVRVLDKLAKEQGTTRSSVIRNLVSQAVRNRTIEDSLKMFQEGRITFEEAAKRCAMSIWELADEAKKRQVPLPYGLDDVEKSADQ